MTDDKPDREAQRARLPKNPDKNPARERLKQALRENLKRRKSQARRRGDAAGAPSNRDDLSPHDGSGKKPGE
jgi:hypothetical protein